MKLEEFQLLLDTLRSGNPDNRYINNKGLAQLGGYLFYPKKGKEHLQRTLLSKLKQTFPETSSLILESLKRYHLTSYYTPKPIIDYKISLLKKSGFEPKTILEPSAGNGAYVQVLKHAFPKAKIIALEPDMLSYEILKNNNRKNERVTVLNCTFENYYRKNKGNQLFDLVITNIPFGDIPIENAFDHDYLKDSLLKNIGNYFNVYTSEMTRTGGVTALLTSAAFHENARYEGYRESILMKNDLLLANRFNNEVFRGENTKVVSDLILLKRTSNKRMLSTKERLFIKSSTLEINSKTFQTNSYFKKFPSQVNGTVELGFFHSRPSITITTGSESLNAFIERQVDAFSTTLENTFKQKIIATNEPSFTQELQEISNTISKPTKAAHVAPEKKPLELKDDYVKNYTRLFLGAFNFDADGQVWYYHNQHHKTKVVTKIEELASDYVALRNEFILLQLNLEKQLLSADKLKPRFEELDYKLDMFHFKWTSLNDQRIFLKEDYYFDRLTVATEARIDGNDYGKNPKFTFESFTADHLTAIVSPFTILDAAKENVKKEEKTLHLNPLEMVKAQFDQTGSIDIKAVAKTFKIPEKELLLKGLADKEYFIQPTLSADSKDYEVVPYFIFASGYLDDKITLVRERQPPFELDVETIIQALETEKAPSLPLGSIEFNFESHFVPLHVKENFLKGLLNEIVKINVGQFSSTLTLLFSKEFNLEAHERFSVVLHRDVKAGYKRILQNFAENKYPSIFTSYKDSQGKTIKKLDKDATLMAQNLYEELQLHFKSYVQSQEQLKKEIEEKYYQSFLADVILKVPDNWLQFPSTLIHKPYQHQIDSVLFGLSRGSALNDHQVGKGKTLSMAMLAYKMKQQGKSRRTILLTLKSVAPQLEREIKANFPQLNILRLNSKNMAKSNRAKTLDSLSKNKNIDLIIAEHGHLKQIPKNKDYVLQILQDKIHMVEQDLDTAKEFGNLRESKKLIKGLIKRKAGLEEKLKLTLKKLEERIEGHATLSTLNIDALLIDEAHYFKNIGFTTRHQNVSGLNNNADNQQNLDLEISIASIHDRIGADMNIFFYSGTPLKNSVTELYAYQRYLIPNELKRKRILNFDAWASIFLKQSVSIEPNIFGNPRMHARFRYFINLPELSKMYNSFTHICRDNHFKTHNLQLDRDFVVLESSKAYEELKQASLDFTKNRRQSALFQIPAYDQKQMKSAHITALNINRSLLIDPMAKANLSISFTTADQFKLRKIASDIAERYKKTKEHKGVCLVFSDLNVWKPNQYNTYDTLAQILTETHGIPKSEIAYAQESKLKNDTEKFQNDIRQGIVRIAMGSTQVLGTGTNIQQRVVGIFHMDIPYSPDAFEQRAGRGLRKGNEVAKHYDNTVIERFYGIKDTTDIFSYSLNTHKQKFREQIRDADPNKRVYDDLIPDDKNLSYAQMQAALIGDMEQFQLVKLTDDLKFLQSQKRLFELNKANSFKTIERIQAENKTIRQQLLELEDLKKHIGKKFVEEPNDRFAIEQQIPIILKFVDDSTLMESLGSSEGDKQKLQSLNKALLEHSNLNVNQSTKKLVAHLPKLNATLSFNAEYVPHNKQHLFWYSLDLTTTQIHGRKQQKFDPGNLHHQFINFVKKLDKEIKTKTFDHNYNLKSLDTHQKKVMVGFPTEKTTKILSLKKEIDTIKKRRAL